MSLKRLAWGGGAEHVIIDSPFDINSATIKFADDNFDDVGLNISEVSTSLYHEIEFFMYLISPSSLFDKALPTSQ